jgi:hypothetical protein
MNLPLGAYALETVDDTIQARVRRLLINGLHGGVDPDFRKATRDLYFRELRLQLHALERFREEVHSQPLRARFRLVRSLRASRMVRYSRMHWIELNDCHEDLLVELYRRINAIRSIRRSVVLAGNARTIHSQALAIGRVPTFRLMQRLGQEGLKRSN